MAGVSWRGLQLLLMLSMASSSGSGLVAKLPGEADWWTSKFVTQFKMPKNAPYGPIVAYNSDRSLIAIAMDETVMLWSTQGGDPTHWGFVKDLGHHGGRVMSVSFSADSSMVVSGGQDWVVKLFRVDPSNPANSSFVKDLGPLDDEVLSLSFSGIGMPGVTLGFYVALAWMSKKVAEREKVGPDLEQGDSG